MRNQPRQRTSIREALAMLPTVPRLYVEFVRYQPSMIGRVIALIPAALLISAIVLLVI
jgi:hypothetical protein